MTPDSGEDEQSRRRTARGENRLPPALAVVVALVVYALLPSSLQFLGRFVIPGIEALLLVALVVTNPRRITRQTSWSREVSIGLAVFVILSNLVSLGLLIAELTKRAPSGENLLVGAMQIWITNVIGFALLFWELDRGGPVARRRLRRADLPAADFRFPQDEDSDTVKEVRRLSSAVSGWVPIFVDFLYVSVTNSSAFSPTDTMPLTTRAKVLMAIQATAALLVSLLLVARAVGSLGG
ncbi:MAG: hypothetical protein JOZ82_02455 [Marmoricola sp.]|nr:hypothetical protein [Marmoricola sp.]